MARRILIHFQMVLVQPELLVPPAGGAFEAAVLEFEFLLLLPHVGRDGHRDLLRLAALVPLDVTSGVAQNSLGSVCPVPLIALSPRLKTFLSLPAFRSEPSDS